MNPKTSLTRRRFLQATSAAIAFGGLLGTDFSPLHAADGRIGENEHFWYRLAPDGPYIDSHRDNKAFGFGDGKIYLSEDNGKTWPHSAPFPEDQNITFSVLLKNGNVLFATREKLFLS